MRLRSQVALVTGAASGISRAVALRFALEGAVVLAADASESGAAETAEVIRREGRTAYSAKLDVSSAEEVQKVIERTLAERAVNLYRSLQPMEMRNEYA